jgi:hypothetical protein
MLTAGVEVLLVGHKLGTSVAMIERVYGHFRNQSYQDAQARLDLERAAGGFEQTTSLTAPWKRGEMTLFVCSTPVRCTPTEHSNATRIA